MSIFIEAVENIVLNSFISLIAKSGDLSTEFVFLAEGEAIQKERSERYVEFEVGSRS